MAKIALQGNDAGTGTLTLQAPVTNLNRNLVLPDVDGTLSTMEQVKLPIGSFMWFTGTVAPEAFVVADGELRSRAAFPDLWAFAQASGNISVDDASWTFGQYSPGNGSTTFRVPKVDDRFIRGKSAIRPVGLVEEDAIRNITGKTAFMSGGTATGAFYNTDGTANGTLSTGGVKYTNTFDASLVVPTADENRPKALTMLPCIKAYDVISDPSVLNAVEVVNEISRLESEKLRKDENINLGVAYTITGNETHIDFGSDEEPIPAGVKRITVMFNGVSTNGVSPWLIRVGDGSIDLTGYLAQFWTASTGYGVNTTGFSIAFFSAQANAASGKVTLDYMSGVWVLAGDLACVTSTSTGYTSGGSKVLSGTLDRIRITTVNGTDVFDAGTINISWEF